MSPSLGSSFTEFEWPLGHLDGLLNRLATLPPKPPMGSGLGPRMCISDAFPGDGAAGVPEQTREDSNPVENP